MHNPITNGWDVGWRVSCRVSSRCPWRRYDWTAAWVWGQGRQPSESCENTEAREVSKTEVAALHGRLGNSALHEMVGIDF